MAYPRSGLAFPNCFRAIRRQEALSRSDNYSDASTCSVIVNNSPDMTSQLDGGYELAVFLVSPADRFGYLFTDYEHNGNMLCI